MHTLCITASETWYDNQYRIYDTLWYTLRALYLSLFSLHRFIILGIIKSSVVWCWCCCCRNSSNYMLRGLDWGHKKNARSRSCWNGLFNIDGSKKFIRTDLCSRFKSIPNANNKTAHFAAWLLAFVIKHLFNESCCWHIVSLDGLCYRLWLGRHQPFQPADRPEINHANGKEHAYYLSLFLSLSCVRLVSINNWIRFTRVSSAPYWRL